jgi:hypothetical protein
LLGPEPKRTQAYTVQNRKSFATTFTTFPATAVQSFFTIYAWDLFWLREKCEALAGSTGEPRMRKKICSKFVLYE